MIVLEGRSQTLVGRFMYGPLDVVSLSGEKVGISRSLLVLLVLAINYLLLRSTSTNTVSSMKTGKKTVKTGLCSATTYAGDMALSTFACCMLRCCLMCSSRSIYLAGLATAAKFAAVARAGTDRGTDRRTPDRCIDPAPHTTQAVPTILTTSNVIIMV